MARRTKWRPCDNCGCPLVRLWIPGGLQTIERRLRCARCTKAELATPCSVRGCLAPAADVDAAVPLCSTCSIMPRPPVRGCNCGECRTCKQRALTRDWRARNAERFRELCRAQEARNADKRLAARKAKRQAEGDRMRAMERAAYAARKGRANGEA